MTPFAARPASVTAGAGVCADCDHGADEHVGANGACIAYVIRFGVERFCACRDYLPDNP